MTNDLVELVTSLIWNKLLTAKIYYTINSSNLERRINKIVGPQNFKKINFRRKYKYGLNSRKINL